MELNGRWFPQIVDRDSGFHGVSCFMLFQTFLELKNILGGHVVKKNLISSFLRVLQWSL